MKMRDAQGKASACWLTEQEQIAGLFSHHSLSVTRLNFPQEASPLLANLKKEVAHVVTSQAENGIVLTFALNGEKGVEGGFRLHYGSGGIQISASEDRGLLYGWFHLLKLVKTGKLIKGTAIDEAPAMKIRMLNHWDNMDGSIERGYAGLSIFYQDNQFTRDEERITRYARLLASIGINALTLNNVNVHQVETHLITQKYRDDLIWIASIFRAWGISVYLCINYASPIELGGLETADPLDAGVRKWWKASMDDLYRDIPDLGGVVVKADSEHRPGPFTYGRTHADGANMLGEVLEEHGGLVFWRCFVYNCLQNWRDRKTDRARAAWDHFAALDGQFLSNVILQIKNGPMDFQVREPVSPLLGAMPNTNQVLELQVTQEYTGQQIDLFWLVPQWKAILSFDTHLASGPSKIKDLTSGRMNSMPYSGVAAVANIGRDDCWTGHVFAQANLYGYGQLLWNPDVNEQDMAREWCHLTFGYHPQVMETVCHLLLTSGQTYENYTAPLGVGWMVNPHHHYGPNIDGYEYDLWGTYHYADRNGLGVDRTTESGTGFVAQYADENRRYYGTLETCPDELVLFFHFLNYDHRLKNGNTVIQHIYDTHFTGVEQVQDYIDRWQALEGLVSADIYSNVAARLNKQKENATEWRDRINTYFYRKSGIEDNKARQIYK